MRPVSGAKIGRIIDIRKFLSHRYVQKHFCKVTQISLISQIYFQSPAALGIPKGDACYRKATGRRVSGNGDARKKGNFQMSDG